MYDVIIIGAGVSGSMLARELSAYQLRIAVIEKGGDVCAGASKGNSATVHSGHDAAHGTKKAYYNIQGNQMFDQLCMDLDVPFVRNGMFVIATNEAEKQSLYPLKCNAELNGVPNVRLMDREEMVSAEGYFGPDVIGSLYAPSSGMVCPMTLVLALCENAVQNGVEFFLATEVHQVSKTDAGFFIRTSKDNFEAKFIFNCAGTHADEINNMISTRQFSIVPRKGEHLLLDKKLAPHVRATISQTPKNLPGGGHTKGMGIMPSANGTILLGCGVHDTVDKDEVFTTREGIDEIIEYFEQNWGRLPISHQYPTFPRHMVIGAFAGLRPHSDTDDYIIGEAFDVPGFYNMAGIESPGLTAAPAIARDLASHLATKYKLAKNPTFNPLHKRRKPFREMTVEERRHAIANDSDYGKIVCRCEEVTRAEIIAAIHSPIPAKTVNDIKLRTRAGMGRCQGGFCGPEIVRILSEELHIPMSSVTLRGEGSELIPYEIGNIGRP